jgi:hypothetical protein
MHNDKRNGVAGFIRLSDIRRIASAFLIVMVASAVTDSQGTPAPRVVLTLFSCAQDIDEQPRVSIVDSQSSVGKQRPILPMDPSWSKIALGVTTTTFNLPPGFYDVSARTTHCYSGTFGLTTVEGHNRSMNATLSTFVVVDAHPTDNSRAVIPASGGLDVDLLRKKTCSLVLRSVVDDGVAYFEGVPAGEFYLRVTSNVFTAVKAIEVPDIFTPFHRVVEFSADDIGRQFRARTVLSTGPCGIP